MIDTHIHVVPPNLPGVGPLSKTLRLRPDLVAEALKTDLVAAGIRSALAMGEWDSPPEDPLGIEKTLRIIEYIPEVRAIGVADPLRGDDPEHLRRVEVELARNRVAALKCYLGYLFYEPAHPNYRRYYELAEKYRIPVIFHAGNTYSPRAKLKYAHPLGIDEVAVDHPKTNFVIAHIGNPWIVDTAELVYKNFNVWTDLSGLVTGDGSEFAAPGKQDELSDLSDSIRRAFRYAERPNRFLFGSDWPLIPIPQYRRFIAAAIPVQFHTDVFLENARILFKI